jgi:predicted nucleic acid-binding protein
MPERIVIVNSTPIIALHSTGRLEILRDLYGTIIIPEAVRDEVTIKDARTLERYNWIHVKAISNAEAKITFTSALHDGEVEVMLLAREFGAGLVIIDDGLARKHAKYLNLTLTGTVGVILRAKEKGLLPEVKSVLDDLIADGLYLSDSVFNSVLRLAGEQ